MATSDTNGSDQYRGYTANNKVQLISGGKVFFDTLQRMIDEARETIHLQIYIFDHDSTGQQIANALINAAQRGVKVYLLVDGYASQQLPRPFVNQLKNAGIYFRYFQPIFKGKNFYFGRRLHHKIIVTDTRYAMVGGVNISNRYNDLPDYPAWLDFAIYVEGAIAREICILCWKTWKGFPAKMKRTPCEKAAMHFNIPLSERSHVRMRRNDWVRGKNQVSQSYLEMLNSAQSNVTILSSYFLPGVAIRKALRQASKRGVKIRVILAGLSDIKLAKHAERYIYDWLLRYNIDIYEYQGSVLHGKVAVRDGKWMTIGSYNVNDISAYASIELNLDVYNPGFVKEVEERLDTIIDEKCIRVTSEILAKHTNIFKKFVRWSSYEIVRGLFKLFTFYFRQEK